MPKENFFACDKNCFANFRHLNTIEPILYCVVDKDIDDKVVLKLNSGSLMQ